MASAPTRSDLEKWTANYIRIRPRFKSWAALSGGAASAPLKGGAQRLVKLDLDVHPGRQLQLHQGVHGLVRGIQDIHQALVRADLELIPRILIAMGRGQNRKTLHFDGQRHGTFDGRAGALRGIDDFARRLVDQAMIESLQADSDVLISHKYFQALTRRIYGVETTPNCHVLRATFNGAETAPSVK